MLQLLKKAPFCCFSVTDFIYCGAQHFFTLGVHYFLDVFEMML